MQAYIIRRLLALIPTLIFASLIVFITVRLIPGDIIDLMLSSNDIGADKKSRAQLEAALGLDRPMVSQYFRWLGAILFEGNLGKSLWQNTPVMEEILHRLPITFELGLMAPDRGADRRHPDRCLLGRAPGHSGRLRHALLRHPRAGAARLLGRHAGDGVPVDLVGLVA
jgi:ABC-type microcin C transport system permease subunit YejB